MEVLESKIRRMSLVDVDRLQSVDQSNCPVREEIKTRAGPHYRRLTARRREDDKKFWDCIMQMPGGDSLLDVIYCNNEANRRKYSPDDKVDHEL